MFSTSERDRLRAALIARARGDERIVGAALAGALVRSLEAAELIRAFGVATRGLLTEITHVDAALARRLEGPLHELAAD